MIREDVLRRSSASRFPPETVAAVDGEIRKGAASKEEFSARIATRFKEDRTHAHPRKLDRVHRKTVSRRREMPNVRRATPINPSLDRSVDVLLDDAREGDKPLGFGWTTLN